uniref:Uncharacterized protein n=1 Tax=Anguilla anguilla TaxID=7936 RepID=A0A0E9U677_ANGAN
MGNSRPEGQCLRRFCFPTNFILGCKNSLQLSSISQSRNAGKTSAGVKGQD